MSNRKPKTKISKQNETHAEERGLPVLDELVLSKPLSRITILKSGDLIVTDLWEEMRQILTGNECGSFEIPEVAPQGFAQSCKEW